MHEVADVELPTQENIQFDLRSLFQGAVRTALEIALEEVLREMAGARRWERLGQRLDHRNGTYLRKVMTSMETIQIEVPRAREGGSAGAAVLGRYKRRTEDVDERMRDRVPSGPR